jgi:hypothetical protein
MEAVPLHLREANEFVARHHRHSLPTVGGKLALGAAQDGKLVGVALAGADYVKSLTDACLAVAQPMRGKSSGKQLQSLNRENA